MRNDVLTISTLNHLLDYDVRKCTSAEIQLVSVLLEWKELAHSPLLKNIIEKYLDFAKAHLEKLEDQLDDEIVNEFGRSNKIMQAFIIETREIISNCADTEVKDASLLSCIQAINHYKISMYGTIAAFALALRKEELAVFFHEVEVKEKQIDDRLSQLAEHEINVKALAPIIQ